MRSLEERGFFKGSVTDPNKPQYAVPDAIVPPGGWGGKDEVLLSKIQPSSFGSSELQTYLRARDIKHVVLIGLTTMGSILGGARAGADLDYHMIIPKGAVIDDEVEVHNFLIERVLPKFLDVVDIEDVVNIKN